MSNPVPETAGFLLHGGSWRTVGDGIYDGGGVTGPENPVDPGDPYSAIATVERLDLAYDVPEEERLAEGPKVFAHHFPTFPIALTTSQNSPTAPDVDTRIHPDGTPFSTANLWRAGYWMPPGQGTVERAFGGLMRTRPWRKRAIRTEPTVLVTRYTPNGTAFQVRIDYRVRDKVDDCRDALKAGLDGFTFNMVDVPITDAEYNMSVSSTSGGAPLMWRKYVELCEAIYIMRQEGHDIYMMPMPDGQTGGTPTQGSIWVAKALIWTMDNYPGILYRENGAVVLAPYALEQAPDDLGDDSTSSVTMSHDYWASCLTEIRKRTPAVLAACYQGYWKTWHPRHDDLTSIVSRWGDRSPAQLRGETDSNRQMYYNIKKLYPGQKFMFSVCVGDYRPNQSNYYEQDHTGTIEESWKTAIGDNARDSAGLLLHPAADLVQIPTWNDYAEGAQIQPSDSDNGGLILDLMMYYLIKYKTGMYPTIKRDWLCLSHRIMPTYATHAEDTNTYTAGAQYTKFMAKRSDGMTVQNTVQVLCMLTDPATVTLNIGGRITTHNQPKGLSKINQPLMVNGSFGTGFISTHATREGSAPFATVPSSENRRVRKTALVQDVGYYFASSTKHSY